MRVDVEPIALQQPRYLDAFRRILRVQVERQPLDLGAVPALEPRRALSRDVAERSYVVGPDPDQRRHPFALYPVATDPQMKRAGPPRSALLVSLVRTPVPPRGNSPH